MTILVTGGAGYIGSHVCQALARAGETPVAVDTLGNGHEWAAQWGPLEIADIRDAARLGEIFRRYEPRAVIHLAAFIEVGISMQDPGAFYRNNLGGSLALLRVMQEQGVGHIVFSSTAAVYGAPCEVPIPESHALAPINPYGHTKLMTEQVLADYDAIHGIRHVALRYFNVAGADPQAEIGEAHDPETHLIPLILQAAEGERSHIAIFGTDYDTPDGTALRDYIHVCDLADAHLLALRYLEEGGSSRAVNLGNGQGHSVREVIDAAGRVTGRDIPVLEAERRAGDPPALVADATLARELLGWRPQFGAIDRQVEDAWRWHRKMRDG